MVNLLQYCLSKTKWENKYTFTEYESSSRGGWPARERSDQAWGGGICPLTPRSFYILWTQSKRSGAYFWWICWNIVDPKITRKIFTRSHINTVFLKWGTDGRQGSEAIEQSEGMRGVPRAPSTPSFCIVGFKISDLVHTLGEFIKYCLSKV